MSRLFVSFNSVLFRLSPVSNIRQPTGAPPLPRACPFAIPVALFPPSPTLHQELQQPCLQLPLLEPSSVNPDCSCAETILDKLPQPLKRPQRRKRPESKLSRRLQKASAAFRAPLAPPSPESALPRTAHWEGSAEGLGDSFLLLNVCAKHDPHQISQQQLTLTLALIPPTIYYTRVGLELGRIVFKGQQMTPP